MPRLRRKNDIDGGGHIDCVSPTIGDIHRVSDLCDDRISISIHACGGNIGRIKRDVFDVQTGSAKQFCSGYSNAVQPVA